MATRCPKITSCYRRFETWALDKLEFSDFLMTPTKLLSKDIERSSDVYDNNNFSK